MICKNCGSLNSDSTAFCSTCGAPLTESEPVYGNVSQQYVYQQNSPQQNVHQQYNPQQSGHNYGQPQPQQAPVLPPKKKKKGAKIAIIIVVIVLVLCMCPLGILGIFAGVGAIFGSKVADKYTANGIVNELEDYDVNDYFDTDDYVEDEYYEESDGIVNELEDFEVNDYFDTDDNNDVATDYIESAIDYSDYLGNFIKEGGDPEWGPCYSVYLSEFDGVNRTATFSVDYIGKNASPCYTTGGITVVLDEFNSADFTWEDSWYNSGSGTIRFVDGDEPVIELEMVQEVTADWNRASLATVDVIELYYEY